MKRNSLNLLASVLVLMSLVFSCSLPGDTSVEAAADNGTRADYSVNRVPSQQPPAQADGTPIPANKAPQFVIIGYDDNQFADGMENILAIYRDLKNPIGSGNPLTFDGTPARASFYVTPGGRDAQYEWTVSTATIASWKKAYDEGHEIGNHTYYHEHGLQFTQERWAQELQMCTDFLVNTVGIPKSAITGFRTPFLEYNPNLYPALKAAGLEYDNSFEGGWRYWPAEDGSTLYWPYTMDSGKPAGSEARDFGIAPGLWQMPTDCVFLPGDTIQRITGFDYNLWFSKSATKQQFVDALKFSLLKKYNGNRSPMNFGGHTNYYSDEGFASMQKWDPASVARLSTTVAERTQAIKEFTDYALTLPDVRVVTTQQALAWVKNPVPLGTAFVQHDVTVTAGPNGSVTPSGVVKVVDGDSLAVTVAPAAGYRVAAATLNGAAVQLTNNQFTITNVTAAAAFEVTFEKDPNAVLYTVTATSDANGSLDKEGAIVVERGQSLTFNATPNAGFAVDTLTVNGVAIAKPSFPYVLANITTDTTLHVTFANVGEKYTKTYYWTYDYAEEPVDGGAKVDLLTINNEVIATVDENLAKRISMEGSGFLPDHRLVNLANGYDWPNSRFFVVDQEVAPYGYDSQGGPLIPWISTAVDATVIPLNSDIYILEFDGVKLPDGSIHDGWFKAVDTSHSFSGKWVDIFSATYTGYQYMINLLGNAADCTLKHQPGKVFTITPIAGPNGTTWPSTAFEAAQGMDRTVSIYPEDGYVIDTVLVDGVAVTPRNGAYTFKNIQAPATIEATFKKADVVAGVKVTATAGPNGTVTPAVSTVAAGSDVTFTITPAAGYVVDAATVNGAAVVVAGNTYTVKAVTADTAFNVTFKKDDVVVPTGLTAEYTITQDWGTGFGANLVVKNGSSAAVTWTVTMTFSGNQKISGWNGNFSQNGNVVTVTPPNWAGPLAPGATYSLGMNGNYTGTNEVPVIVVK